MITRLPVPLLALFASAVAALPQAAYRADYSGSQQPTVKIHQGTVHGFVDHSYGLEQFFGIPFAKPPVGELRFAKPQHLDSSPSNKMIDATRFGNICVQSASPSPLYNMSEDCLNLNIVRPAGTTEHDKLPVLTWIYGGAFLQGSIPAYNASELVHKSVEIGKPIVFVAMNYRVGPFGFIGGSEVADSDSATSNAGLYDQRFAMKWIRSNIRKFGGDPHRVTLFGESAGAMSTALQNFAYDGDNDGLWHAAIMDSGGIAPGPLLTPKHPTVEQSFKSLAEGVGCTSGSLLECLRKVDATKVQSVAAALSAKAGGTLPIPGALAWLPLVDYELITDYPSVNLAQGKLADIPIIQGNNLDEGTLFGQKQLNSSDQFETWVRSAAVIYNTSYTEQALQQIFKLYPDIPEQGSPYYNAETATSAGTTNLSSRIYQPLASNQYKRSSAFFGDFTFQAHRRTYLQAATLEWKTNRNRVWSFEFQQNDKFAVNGTGSPLGAYHSSELKYFFVRPDGRQKDPVLANKMPEAYISFTYYHDPTVLSGLQWPCYADGHKLLQLKGDNITVIPDTYRREAMDALTNRRAARVFGF
ncbi:related to Lipase 2 precursor [Sporisorium reilianum SRZ2]|uniref:Carboxylic ester hydrolase n=1 Tax=Sporisorium reilianum (strain SRZ2) TaxID=999809 RepID=E6ZJR6_SPORE|nr:related to Lipase 2 precursor [Sporisorium reilianum SRZ2]